MPPPTPRTMRFRYRRCIGLPFQFSDASSVTPAMPPPQEKSHAKKRAYDNTASVWQQRTAYTRGGMSIRDWPVAERPREKLLEWGAASLSDAELLAIFLRTGVSGRSAVDQIGR